MRTVPNEPSNLRRTLATLLRLIADASTYTGWRMGLPLRTVAGEQAVTDAATVANDRIGESVTPFAPPAAQELHET